MKPGRGLPIQRQMLVMTLLICGAVLCVAIAAFFSFQVLDFRSTFRRDNETLAVIIANNSTAAIAFKDDQVAGEIVGALRAKPAVVSANLVLPDGAVFAHFGKAEEPRGLADFPAAGESRFLGGQLLVTQPVVLKKERLATLYLRSDYRRTFMALLGFYGEVVLGIVMVSTGLAAFLSSRMGRTITGPLLHLAQTARLVGEKKDYSVRAAVSTRGDELAILGESFNEMLARIESQDAALSLSRRQMEALIHSIDGIVWERTPDTFRFTFVSRQSEDVLGYAPDAWLAKANFWEEKLHPQDSAKVVRAVRDAVERAQPYKHEYRMIAADGRTVWIRESGTVLVERGQPVTLRGIFLDITREKFDAEQLNELNQQLISTSRLAGMAEVATGVLHNVGNVLNSVSVTATLVAERLRRSKVGNLQRAVATLREQNGRLAKFLTKDPKGKLLPEYLVAVTDQLVTEQGRLAVKMEGLGQHIEHIKEIVATQQNYAKASGVYECLPLPELIEDALRINAAAFDRHGIELVRDFQDGLPAVLVDRHKVLQILINLLRNAKYAIDAQNGESKLLVVRAQLASPNRVRISVIDNGIGIPPAHLTKIFSHGFTTRKDGHGFGLHSGANAAKEMGGSLTAHSQGPGQGAEFILELPLSLATTPRHAATISLPK